MGKIINCGLIACYGIIPFFDNYPQREVIHNKYLGNTKKEVEQEYRKTDLQYSLTAVCSTNRERFSRIQMEIGKELYLDDVIKGVGEKVVEKVGDEDKNKYWLMKRSQYAQGALFHVLVAGSQEYEKLIREFLENHTLNELTDEELILIARECWGHYTTKIMTEEEKQKHYGKTDEGRAYAEPEIALAALDGRLTVFDVEDWVRHGGYGTYGYRILNANGVSSSKLIHTEVAY